MQLNRRTLLGSAGLIAGNSAVSVLGMTAAALAGSGPVSSHPAIGTPALPNRSHPAEQVRQLVHCGGTMYAVGTFSQVNQGGTSFTRHNAFSFSATAPFRRTSWDPDVNGKVNRHGCNRPGPRSIPAPGMVGLSPAGAVVFNPTRSRGFGADDMLVTGAGLWVASDNAFDSNACGHVHGLAGICFLPYG